MFEMVVDNTYYVKYDLSNGRVLMANMNDGKFYGFAQEKNAFIIQAGQDPTTAIKNHISGKADQIKTICGLNQPNSIQVLGQNFTIPPNKTATCLGRSSDIETIKAALGDFKNIDLGEIAGGINILNRPETMYSIVSYNSWWLNTNLPWIQRNDKFFISSPTNELDKLLETTYNLEQVPTITAYELRELINAGIKPENITLSKWNEISNYIQRMENSGMFN